MDYALEYIAGTLCVDLLHSSNADVLATWRAWHLTWRLDLYAPPNVTTSPGPCQSWRLSFADEPLTLQPSGPTETDMRTAVAATGIYDVLTGKCSSYGFLFLDRIRHCDRVYVADGGHIRTPDGGVPEPLLNALTGPRDLDRLFIENQIRRWRG